MTNQVNIMPMIALRGTTVLPEMIVHFDVSREKSIRAVEAAMLHDQKVFLLTQKDPEVETPELDDLYRVGTIAYIKQVVKLPQDLYRVLVEGLDRAEILSLEQEEPYLKAECEIVTAQEEEYPEPVKDAMLRSIRELFQRYCRESGKISKDLVTQIMTIEDVKETIDQIAVNLPMSYQNKQKLLEAVSLNDRYEILGALLGSEIEVIHITKDLQRKVKSHIDKNQREYILREQLKTIREELGEDNTADDIEEFKKQLKELGEQESVKEISEKEIITGNLEDDFYYIAGELENASNKLVYLVPRETFLKENRKILQHILEMVLLVIGFTVCTMLYFSRRLARPLVEVAQTLEKAPNGMAVLEEPRGSFQEMSKFVSCYNQAGKKIEELLEKVERESRLKEKAHYEMLMSQISPHFIFNTVNSIRIMAIKEGQDRAGGNENTEKALEALGDILHAVYSNKNGMTTVGQETALLKAYVDIMQMRFGSSFQYYNVIPTELFYYEIPAFTMQPIVENAILHGVKGVTAGQIIVSAIEYENDFVISVFNNGNSADKKKIEDLLKGEKNQRAVTGIGLYNVNSRLKLLYGESYGLIYNEKVRNGFEIWVRLPKKITESEER